MGTSTSSQRLARMAKLRLYSHDDGGPAYSLHWHWQGWDDLDGTVLDQNGGSYTGSADEVVAKLVHLIGDLHTHMLRGLAPFPSVPGGQLVRMAPDHVSPSTNGHHVEAAPA